MKGLWFAGRALALDFLSTLFFLGLFELTHSITLSVSLGIAVAIAQFGFNIWRKKPIDRLQWVSLALVLASGGATLFTGNPVFVKFKPSIIYLVVAWAMLEKGWMTRFMPPPALELMPDLVIVFGYIWAGLMVFSALLNAGLALYASVAQWGAVMSLWALFSKIGLFFLQYAIMRFIGHRRGRALAQQGGLHPSAG